MSSEKGEKNLFRTAQIPSHTTRTTHPHSSAYRAGHTLAQLRTKHFQMEAQTASSNGGISQLPPSAANAAQAALDKAMTEVTNGVGPGSSARAPPTETNNNRDRAGSSASGASGSSKKENGVKGEEEEEEEEKEDGELSSQDINLPTSSSQQQDIRTVFQDPDNFNVKHPLASRWTLWFDNPSQRGMSHAKGSKESWGDDLNKVVDIDCVEEFWG